jgi:hypothetical protein
MAEFQSLDISTKYYFHTLVFSHSSLLCNTLFVCLTIIMSTNFSSSFTWFCRSATHIWIDNNVKFIPDKAFYENHELVEVILSEWCLQEFWDEAFACCSSLQKIDIPKGLLSIGNGTFSNCQLFSTICIPSKVTSIGIVTFVECPALKEVVFSKGEGGSLLTMGGKAFFDYPSLTKITVLSTMNR